MRILIADDEPISRRRLEATLARLGHDVVVVSDGRQAIADLLNSDGPRLAILDWMMPEADGLDVCRTVRSSAPHYVYLILLTSRDRREDMVEALDAGADDFLTKPFHEGELRARLRSGERVITLQEDLLEIQSALRHQATHDALTGLWNRRMILERLEQELHQAARERHPLAVAMIDLDYFKQINDQYGHAAGDAALQHAGRWLRSALRDYDALGRFGGEEFLAILPGCGQAEARKIADRARTAVASAHVRTADVVLQVSASLGVAWTDRADDNPTALLHAADQALYRAKANGRNRVELAEQLLLAP